jgi:hypothetical protein
MSAMSSSADASARAIDIEPDPARTVGLQVGIALAFVGGLAVYGGLAELRHDPGLLSLDPDYLFVSMLVGLGGMVVLTVLQLAVQGLAMLVAGARPEFGGGMLGKLQPYLYITAPGHRFTRRDYLVVALLPTAVVGLLGAVLVWWWAPFVAGVVLAIALFLSGCVPAWWVSAVVLRQPEGSTYEDLRLGVRVHLPA